MLNYKIISIDLDGTLLDTDMHVSNANKVAIEQFKNMGGFVVPNSGRSFGEMPIELRQDPNVRFYICSDGGDIFDKYQNSHIFLGMDRSMFERVYDIVKDYDVFLMVHTNGDSFVDKKLFNLQSMQEYNVNKYFIAHTFENCKTTDDMQNLIDTVQKVELLVVFFKNLNDKPQCWKRLEQIGMHVAPTSSGNIEISAPTAGKGNGLIKLAEHLGIPISQTMAVGDNYNDEDMLSKAGLSVAVENAKEQIKQKTNVTVCANYDHVIPDIIKKIIKEI
ncbi:MAG: HAD family phosphatase [Clostridia bacterium]|nr:HAD family phosphatase [Clostridia bacterium]